MFKTAHLESEMNPAHFHVNPSKRSRRGEFKSAGVESVGPLLMEGLAGQSLGPRALQDYSPSLQPSNERISEGRIGDSRRTHPMALDGSKAYFVSTPNVARWLVGDWDSTSAQRRRVRGTVAVAACPRLSQIALVDRLAIRYLPASTSSTNPCQGVARLQGCRESTQTLEICKETRSYGGIRSKAKIERDKGILLKKLSFTAILKVALSSRTPLTSNPLRIVIPLSYYFDDSSEIAMANLCMKTANDVRSIPKWKPHGRAVLFIDALHRYVVVRLHPVKQEPSKQSPHDCERDDLDPQAVHDVTKMMLRIWKSASGGCFGAQIKWLKDTYFPQPVQHELSHVNAREDRDAARNLEDVAESLKATVDTLRKLQRLVEQQVMEDVAYKDGDDGDAALVTVRAAIRLSSVCRRFRDIALRSSLFWCRISSDMHIELVRALCNRLTTPIGVVILKAPTNMVVPFIQAVTSRSQYWSRFIQDYSLTRTPLLEFTQEDLQAVKPKTGFLSLPFLNELSIHYPKSELNNKPYFGVDDYYALWYTPQLKTINATNFVPDRFLMKESYTSITIKFDFLATEEEGDVTGNLRQLTEFLIRCPNVKDLSINLSYLRNSLITATDLGRRLMAHTGAREIFPNIEFLDFNFAHSTGPEVKAFLDSVRFPNAKSLTLHISWFSNSTTDKWTELILQEMENFAPRITDLTLNFFFIGSHFPLRLKHIQLPNLPGILHLTITTMESRSIFLPPDGPFCPCLRNLTFSCCECLFEGWVSLLLKRLREQGNTLNLSVEYCLWSAIREADDMLALLPELDR
ncbi:hypothetical protein SCHPADRAFT_891655 [Schizopora paradoxa]|uniref:Uncharacterized protein n=1 Tax=Schizopora paradoxa TaxID=27342 RepID=A0A0H2S308_9AGAM|nr:hypothetical protein SCHPADRAFT_891655 [Schizopora paradoxa]